VTHQRLRAVLVTLWLAVAATALYTFFFHRDALASHLQGASTWSVLAGSGLYLVLGSLRGFTFIPATTLLLTALPFMPPTRLFLLTLAGILVASASIYGFSEALHIEELLAQKHRAHVVRLTAWLQRYELPVIIGWSFFPLVPTDLICYVCGVLRVGFWKMLLGVAIGEGAICAVYIYAGDRALQMLGWR
jgi:uncharacterized membrane protein YdjX (TVP38/TMEM64 family)